MMCCNQYVPTGLHERQGEESFVLTGKYLGNIFVYQLSRYEHGTVMLILISPITQQWKCVGETKLLLCRLFHPAAFRNALCGVS